MELSWTTFLFEIVNFLVLVWILKRFLYKPVLDVIARRRAAIEKNLAEAREKEGQAQALQAQYQNRLADWEKEKAAAHEALQHELEAERARLMSALMTSLDQEREKARVLEERRLHEARLRAEQLAMEHAAHFASRLLSRLAGPELEEKLVQLALDDLAKLPPERLETLRAAWERTKDAIRVSTAYPMDDARRQRLQEEFTKLLGPSPAEWQFRQESSLIAGLRVGVGPWVLRANIQDETGFFAEVGDEAG